MNQTQLASCRLKDHTLVELGRVDLQDRERLLNGFKRISKKTNIARFHTFKKQFTEDEIQYLLTLDNVNQLAVGAIDPEIKDVGIGLARYVRSEPESAEAEVAIIIIDAYQGKGLGKLLYTELMKQAYRNNIRTFINYVKKDNLAMIQLLKSLGAIKRFEYEQVFEFSVDLPSALARLNASEERH